MLCHRILLDLEVIGFNLVIEQQMHFSDYCMCMFLQTDLLLCLSHIHTAGFLVTRLVSNRTLLSRCVTIPNILALWPSEISAQPGHPPGLIRVLDVLM